MALASLCVALAAGQEPMPPSFLRAHALVVRFLAATFANPAIAQGGGGSSTGASPGASVPSLTGPATASPSSRLIWSRQASRYTVSGVPVSIRLNRDGLVVVVQVTPYDRGDEGIILVAQGQVWKTESNGSVSLHTTAETLSLAFGERAFFYPLGLLPGSTTVFQLEMAIDRFGAPPTIAEGALPYGMLDAPRFALPSPALRGSPVPSASGRPGSQMPGLPAQLPPPSGGPGQ
ncbi:MAG: hypothetical protein WCQ50_21510 [Spirochaetota bacterium]